MGAHQPGGMRAGKFAVGDLRAALLANRGAGGVAYVYLTRRQTRQDHQPGVERRSLFGDDHLRIGGQRLGIHRAVTKWRAVRCRGLAFC